MKVLGKDEHITKFEAFMVIKKELECAKQIDKHLCTKMILKKEDSFKNIYEKYFMKLLSDKILYKGIQKYIADTSPHLIPKKLYNKDYQQLTEWMDITSKKIVNFFKEIHTYNIDKKEKIQMIDINCINLVDLYVILNYGEKKCDENKIEDMLNLLKKVHITNFDTP
ncbi:DNA-directed RNA polymerase II subunit RPB4 [Plasmodium gonderi]|uniref:DNA-directed RNA polymerase II subunit RPB4 n=1 Tax=Plasmodium gonderi TaxID=77519 RepID=A0A1Y1JTB0_PLAGO|nr:DNA-directed RNA polymerase II subunit RPB4 [Plasmodium gonderi]GAW83174.1 DNA-directed RNA polymerase II subunit RPB4 [Plasmodium gonderi]